MGVVGVFYRQARAHGQGGGFRVVCAFVCVRERLLRVCVCMCPKRDGLGCVWGGGLGRKRLTKMTVLHIIIINIIIDMH